MAAVQGVDARVHALRDESFQVRMDGAVVIGDDVVSRLGPPRHSVDFLGEQIRGRREVGGPDNLLFLFGQVSSETGNTRRRIQTRPSVTSTCAKTSVTGNFSC